MSIPQIKAKLAATRDPILKAYLRHRLEAAIGVASRKHAAERRNLATSIECGNSNPWLATA